MLSFLTFSAGAPGKGVACRSGLEQLKQACVGEHKSEQLSLCSFQAVLGSRWGRDLIGLRLVMCLMNSRRMLLGRNMVPVLIRF